MKFIIKSTLVALTFLVTASNIILANPTQADAITKQIQEEKVLGNIHMALSVVVGGLSALTFHRARNCSRAIKCLQKVNNYLQQAIKSSEAEHHTVEGMKRLTNSLTNFHYTLKYHLNDFNIFSTQLEKRGWILVTLLATGCSILAALEAHDHYVLVNKLQTKLKTIAPKENIALSTKSTFSFDHDGAVLG